MRLVSVVAFFALITACGPAKMDPPVDPLPFEPASPTAAPDPAKFGPYPVGVRTVTFEDTGRRDAAGNPRVLVTEIWYPAVQTTRGQPGVVYDILPIFTPEQQAAIGVGTIPLLQTSAVRDAEPARAHGKFPLIVFSHGQAAIRWQSTYYTVLLASHGYIVVSTDHQGGTLYDVVRGQLESAVVGVQHRPDDVIYLLNRFTKLRDSDPLYGLVDETRIGVTGHSFGALTSFRVAALDARVKAIVPQAPFDASVAWLGLPRPSLPIHVQAAHQDKTLEWDTNVEPTMVEVKAAGQPWWLLDISNGGHFTFSDLCAFDLASISDRVMLDIPGANIKKVLEDGCGPTAPPASVAQPLINHFAVAFFNAQLRGSTQSLDLMTQAKVDEVAGPNVGVLTKGP
ncbi:MAG: acetylxylan esterase [Myxococcaceae bacterium]